MIFQPAANPGPPASTGPQGPQGSGAPATTGQQGLPNDPCANPSLAAAGVDARQQIANAQALIAAGNIGATSAYPNLGILGQLYGYYLAVHTGGPNDIKNQPGPGYGASNQVGIAAGNISFGITCPFGAKFCQAAAGLAQGASGALNIVSRGKWGHGRPGPINTYFDSPSDNQQILTGQAMRSAGCHE